MTNYKNSIYVIKINIFLCTSCSYGPHISLQDINCKTTKLKPIIIITNHTAFRFNLFFPPFDRFNSYHSSHLLLPFRLMLYRLCGIRNLHHHLNLFALNCDVIIEMLCKRPTNDRYH